MPEISLLFSQVILLQLWPTVRRHNFVFLSKRLKHIFQHTRPAQSIMQSPSSSPLHDQHDSLSFSLSFLVASCDRQDRQIRPQIAIQSGQESLRLRVSSLALALALSLGLGSLETSLPRWPRRKPARWLWLRLFLEPIKWPADQSCCCCSSLLSLLSAVHGNGNGNAEVVCRWTLH